MIMSKKTVICLLKGAQDREKSKKNQEPTDRLLMVEVTGFEPATPCSQSTYATNCATPRFEILLEDYSIKSAIYKREFSKEVKKSFNTSNLSFL